MNILQKILAYTLATLLLACLTYIGIRCITEGNVLQMCLGWFIEGLVLTSIAGIVYLNVED